SMDRTMMLWQHEQRSGLWMSQASVGDAGAQCLGYFGACFSPTGARVVAHGFTGAMHLWDSSSDADTNTSAGHRAWVPLHAAGGHFGPVAGCCWAADGRCVLSVGEDQTARVWTRVRAHWCEVARPQVHGHDFTCVASVPKADEDGAASAQYAFISGSEEKMLRAFEAPQVFVDTLDMARCRAPGGGGRQAVSGRAFGAAIPALGLSNKAVFDGGDDGDDGEGASNAGVGSGMAGGHYNDGPDFAPCAAPASSEGPPLEEHLSQNTLWPEVHKLYGHGSDVYCLAVSRDGRYAASACVAKSAVAADVFVWATRAWVAVAQLPGHTLTVTGLAWAHGDGYLASCSRDRSFSIFRRVRGVEGAEDSFVLAQRVQKAHARVLWGVAWSPDDRVLATGARDEAVKLWAAVPQVQSSDSGGLVVGERAALTLMLFGSPVTALAFAPAPSSSASR
ncbi:hypothetical protein FOA52_015945, partial [Chlamydomonas sp. UWO 241]